MSMHFIMEKPLTILREELGRTLQQVQSGLVAYFNNPVEVTRLQAAAIKMDQVRGVFLMLEQADAAALAQELAALVQGLFQDGATASPAIPQTLLQTLSQFSAYLTGWQQGERQPVDLSSLHRELRAVQGLTPLPAAVKPATVVDASIPEAGAKELRQLAGRLRPALQRALLGILRGQQVTDNLAGLARIFGQLRELSPAEPDGRFWRLAETLVQNLLESRLPLTQQLHLLLRDLDKQIKYLSETGRIFASSAAEQVFEQRLIEQLGSGGSGLAQLQNRLGFESVHAASVAAYRGPAGTLTPPAAETMEQVCGLLQESLNQVKENIESFTHTRQAYEELQQAIVGLHARANVLIMLNMDGLARFLQPIQETLQQWLVDDDIAEEDCIRLAGDLVLLTGGLHVGKEWISELPRAAATATGITADERARLLAGERRRTARVALQEAVQVMQRARVMVATALEQGAAGLWNDLRVLLHSVSGALALLEYEQIAGLMRNLENSVGILAGEKKPHPGVPVAVAEVMSALEYNLEILSAGKKPDEALLQLVEHPLNHLIDLLRPGDHFHPADNGNPALQQSIPVSVDTAAQAFEPLADDSANKPMPAGAPTASERESRQPFPLPAGSVDPEILDIFFEELQDELASIRENVLLWRTNPTDRQVLLALRRSFHTLKGSGRMVQQWAIGNFAASFEQVLNRIRDDCLAPSAQIVDWVDEAQHVLHALVGSGRRDGAETPPMAALKASVETLLQGEEGYTEQDTRRQPVEDIVARTMTAKTPPVAPFPVAAAAPVRAGSPPAAPPGRSGVEVDPELIEIFQCEANEILDASDVILERWKEDPGNEPLLNDLRRAMHTLKGSSRMAGFMVIGDLAHAIESVLDQIPSRSRQDTGVMVDALQRGLDRLNSMLVDLHSGGAIHPADELIRALRTLVGEPVSGKPQPAVAPKPPPIEPVAVAAALPVTPEQTEQALTELDRETVEAFQSEAAEILDASDIALRRWNEAKSNSEPLNELRRRMHTLKGSAHMAGFPIVGDLAQAIQMVLDAVSKALLQPSAALVETLQRALDGLNERLVGIQNGVELRPVDGLIDSLTVWLTEMPSGKPVPIVALARESRPRPLERTVALGAEDTIRVSTALLNKLVNDMGESGIYRARVEQGLAALRFNLSEMDQTVYRLRQQLRRLEIETEAQILFRYDKVDKEHEKGFDPLELDRFSELQQLSRSLMEVIEDLGNIKSTLQDQTQEMSGLLEQQAKANKEVQQGLMRTRMVRFNTIEPRLRRVLRQAAQELGKRAELHLEGAESEVDRTVLESMVAPLEHMLRNAISHGVELPERRVAGGKPEMGGITLAIRREGAELVIDLQDDGAGLNFEAIRAKGEALGLLKPEQAITQAELIALLMRPGFTTATKVTQIAGRGVGLDILNDAIKVLRGTLLIQTEQGKGTNFIIRLPFSLAVTPALLVRVGGDTYAVPLLSIESVARLGEGELQAYLEGKIVEHKHGKHTYPLHNLGILFGADSIRLYDEIADKRPPILLFRNAEASAALQVDAVLGNQEIIIKPLGPQFLGLTGIAGATVLGDGRVVVVLDLAAMVRNLASLSQRQAEAMALDLARHEIRAERIRAMVIDDSITMRKVTSRFLERQNMSVTMAKDGLEAVTRLEEQIPDLIILDIEMPRMDGFELAAHIRNQPNLRHIPIIMVTSRGGEKHRERAAKLGVDEYLTKPYQENEMMNVIRRVLGERALELRSKPVF